MAIGLFSMRISKVSSFVALNLAVAVKPGLPVVQFHSLLLIPLPKRQHQVKVCSVWKMRNVRHSV